MPRQGEARPLGCLSTADLRTVAAVAQLSRGGGVARRVTTVVADRSVAMYVAAVLFGTTGLLRVAKFYHDDAFISLRYASRLLAGDGLTWNAGERVEGFTHPLWLAQISLLGALGVDLETASRLLGCLYLLAIFALWWRSRAAPVLLLVLATQPGLLLWSVSGLETTSFAFWLALGAWLTWLAGGENDAAAARGALAGTALAAAALTRPEGMGAGLLAVACLGVTRRWRAASAAALSFSVITGGYEAFRLAYFGDLLPNTAHAKLGGLPLLASLCGGLAYLRETAGVWLPAALAAAVGLVSAPGRRPFAMLMVAAPVLLSLLLAGGDHMPAARLTVPLVVVLLLAAAIAGRDGFRRARVMTGVALLAVAGQTAMLFTMPVRRDAAAIMGEHVGRVLGLFLPDGAVVATATAGSTPYFAPSLSFIDTLGLNDRHIARRHVDTLTTKWQRVPGHLKGDGAYVLHRAPDVIILGPAEGSLGTMATDWFLTDYELLASPEFRNRYRPYRLTVGLAPELLAERGLPNRISPDPLLRIVLYLRTDSTAVSELARFGSMVSVPSH
jgi:arabinofuranosyltransferase